MDDRPTARGGSVIVTLPASFDVASAGQMYERFSAAVAAGADQLIADLTATTFCDAAGVHRLVMTGHQAAARGCGLRLVIPPGALMRQVLVLLEVDHLLPVYSSVEEALRPLAGPEHPLMPGNPPASAATGLRLSGGASRRGPARTPAVPLKASE